MAPNNNDQNNTPTTGIIDKARNFIHEAVKTDEQRQAEIEAQKTIIDKAKDLVPENAADAGKRLDSVANDFKAKFQERLDEGTPRENQATENSQAQNEKKFNLIGNTRQKIYDMTKSNEEIQAEIEANKTLVEKAEEHLNATQKMFTEKVTETQKSLSDTMKSVIPNNAADVGKSIDSAALDVKTKFQERLDEGTEREGQRN